MDHPSDFNTLPQVCLLALPLEVLEMILQRLDRPQGFVRSCRQLYRIAKSPFLRAKYLLSLHGPTQVLTRTVVEKHKLTVSILTPAVVSYLISMGAIYRDRNEFIRTVGQSESLTGLNDIMFKSHASE
ncbi:hypothetical protein BGZ94_008500 [Podila epigama]|nr:hypothetical protein BGZ94_008500 [Podila epigama]